MAGALTGYRVLEFGHNVAGQVLGMLMSDQGAEVIKIEPLVGERFRGTPAFSVWNRGKKSIALDLDNQEAKSIERLVASADVLIEDLVPGTLSAVGLSPERCEEINPSLVYASLPAFGPDHPSRDLPALEPIVAAATGVYADRTGNGPSFISVPHSSIFGAMTAAPAIVAALFHREMTGQGQRVTVPLYDAMFVAMGTSLVKIPEPPLEFEPPSHPVIARFYECKDGRWVNINGGYARALRPMVEAFGHPEWADALLDVEFLTKHPEDRKLWIAELEPIWRKRTALEWESVMQEAGVPCTMCRTVEEWLEEDQALESGAVVQVDDPVFGPMRQVGIQVKMGETNGAIRSPAPALGAHTDEILSGLR